MGGLHHQQQRDFFWLREQRRRFWTNQFTVKTGIKRETMNGSWFRSTPRPVTADKWFSFNLPFQTSTRKLLQKSRLGGAQKKNVNLPSKPLIQNSEFKTGASLSRSFKHISCIPTLKKESADYKQYIHVSPWEGASKASASKQGLEHIVKGFGRLMQLSQCTVMCSTMESDWPCGKMEMLYTWQPS